MQGFYLGFAYGKVNIPAIPLPSGGHGCKCLVHRLICNKKSGLIYFIHICQNQNINIFILKTRTHSMARHRKSPRSRRNLMVIDPLTPSQGHQVDHELIIFSVSWSTAHPLKFDMPDDHVQKIKFLTPPQGPGGGVPKKLRWCMCHSMAFM